MAAPRTVRVPPDGEVARTIKEAAATGETVLVEIGDDAYPLRVGSSENGIIPELLSDGGPQSSRLERLHRRSHMFFHGPPDIEGLAREQGVRLDASFDDLKGDFWPEDESIDEFIDTVRRGRREGGGN